MNFSFKQRRLQLVKYDIKTYRFLLESIFVEKEFISPTFCVVPWTQMATNSMGAYRVCCNATQSKNLIRDENGSSLRVQRTSAYDAWNSPTYQKIRTQMLRGERPDMCERCFREEDSGVLSARQNWNRQGLPMTPEVVAPPTVKIIDLRLGNLCNLKCRMCNPYSSSQWVTDWNELAGIADLIPEAPISPEEIQRIRSVDWPEDAQSWQNLDQVLSSVEEIYLTGGEPFLSLEQVRLLQRLIDDGRAGSVILRYNTNLTTLPDKLVKLWKSFKLIRLNISFDGYGPLNDYIRHPSQWVDLERHFNKLLQLKSEGLPLELTIHTTVQMYNITKLDQIVSYFWQNYQMIPYMNLLNHPHCLNIRVLPDNLKKQVLQKLQMHGQHSAVVAVANYLQGESWTQKYFSQFKKYTLKLDQMRGQNFLDVCPEFQDSFAKQRGEGA